MTYLMSTQTTEDTNHGGKHGLNQGANCFIVLYRYIDKYQCQRNIEIFPITSLLVRKKGAYFLDLRLLC